MGRLVDIELNKKLFKNVDEGMLTTTFAALENCFVTESNGLSRFPGLNLFCDFGGNAEMHMSRFGNDMIAVGTDGRSFRVDTGGEKEPIDGPFVLGGSRTSFARTVDGLMMAGGAQIIKFDGVKNSILSKDAPLSDKIGFIDGYVLAVEKNSGRFQHCKLNSFGEWKPQDTFAVNGSPDNIGAMLITPFNEILIAGEESIEQYERLVGGQAPFFRRWSVGDGISEPDTLCYADNAAWGLNTRNEFVRLSGQTTQSVSDDIQKKIEDSYALGNIGAMDKAWAHPIFIKGQKFIVFQAPLAQNAYGTKGFTAIFDIRRGQWFELFGWNESAGVPDLWPGRSVFQMWGKTFIGGNGKIYELATKSYNNDTKVQRAYVRTAHFDTLGTMSVDGLRLTVKRGFGSYDVEPKIMLRTNPDNKGFGNIQYQSLGAPGDGEFVIEFGPQGIADTWQFEIWVTDDCPFELRRLQAEVTKMVR